MGSNSKTISINIDFLSNKLKLIRQGITSIFINSKYFVISPAIKNDYNWFDLRKIILEKNDNEVKIGYLLIRLKEDFILLRLDDVINKLIDYNKYVYTKSIGEHWKFNIINNNDNLIIKSRSDSSKFIQSRFYSKEELIDIFNR